jgi:Ca2+/Na+ antiporter
VFNILAVAAVCGIGAGMVVPLEWWSVTRDCLCYSLSVILLIIVLNDERIYWYEALVLVLVYTFYILAMYKNSFLKRGAERLVYSVERRINQGKTESTYTMKEKESRNGNQIDMEAQETRDEVLIENALKNLQDQAAQEKEEMGLFKPPHGQGCRAMGGWCLGWPVRALYMITIPDCREVRWRRWYPLTFFMCVVWIGILAYLVNWMMTVIGHTFQIPDSIMGLTFIAAGTSVPECVSSIIVARQGLGSMALSNSIGSNTFDILMCLGLPWLIRASMIADDKEINYIQINSTGLEYSTIMLITSLCVLYGILAANKFVLDKKVGFTALALYAVFLVMASLFELNVFFKVNLPTCQYQLDPL